MNRRSFFHKIIWVMAIGIAVWGRSTECLAQATVAAGYDLFQTVPGQGTTGTNFMGVNFQGAPLSTFNFGGTIGTKNVGVTDTIIQRLSPVSVATFPNSGTTSLLVNALQLASTAPTLAFGGATPQTAFITLNPTTASTGSMTITFNSAAGGTFTSSLNLFFDIRLGSINAPPVQTDVNLQLTNSGAVWGRVPPTGSVLVNGVNNFLDGTDHNQDFFLNGLTSGTGGPPLMEFHPGVGVHAVQESGTVPEPSSWVLLITAGLMGSAYARWARRRS
jgi:hypothetical protein